MSEWHVEQKQDYPTNYHFILNEQGATVAMVAYDRSAAEQIVADHGAAARLAAAESLNARLVAALVEVEAFLRLIPLGWMRDHDAAAAEDAHRIELAISWCHNTLATVPSEPSGGAEGERHESWCPASGGECSCDAPEFGPND